MENDEIARVLAIRLLIMLPHLVDQLRASKSDLI